MKRNVTITSIISGLVLLLASCGQAPAPSVSFDVLYFFDGYFDATAQSTYSPLLVDGIEAEGHTVTTATSFADFDSKLASGNYDVAVYLDQSSSGIDIDQAAFEAFVDGGGRAVLVDWNETASLATTFDASYTGNLDESSADLQGSMEVGITDPLTLTNPGWSVFSMGLAAGANGTSLCTFGNGDSCLVFGNSGRTALVGFLADTLPVGYTSQFWSNVIVELE